MAKNNRAKKAIGRTTNLTASRGNAGRNKAQSIIRELRSTRDLPEVIYNYRGGMNTAERRAYVSNLIGRRLSNNVHVRFTADKKLNRTTTGGGIRRTLEGYRISYTYS